MCSIFITGKGKDRNVRVGNVIVTRIPGLQHLHLLSCLEQVKTMSSKVSFTFVSLPDWASDSSDLKF